MRIINCALEKKNPVSAELFNFSAFACEVCMLLTSILSHASTPELCVMKLIFTPTESVNNLTCVPQSSSLTINNNNKLRAARTCL